MSRLQHNYQTVDKGKNGGMGKRKKMGLNIMREGFKSAVGKCEKGGRILVIKIRLVLWLLLFIIF